MKILMLIDSLHIGGAETHVLTLSRALTKLGAQVSVLSSGGALENDLKQHGIPTLRFPAAVTSPVGLLRCALFLRRLVRKQSFDVLHAHTRRCAALLRLLPRMAAPAVAVEWPAYRRRGVRRALAPLRVVTAHAAFTPRYRSLSYWGETTVAVSEDIRAHLLRCFSPRLRQHPIRVIPNGVELTPKPPAARDSRFWSITFASRLDEDCSAAATCLLQLAPSLAAAAARTGRELRLRILGGGSAYARLCALRDTVLSENGTTLRADNLRLVGYVSDPRPYLSAADVFVGVSRAALEALSCGCRVVLAGDEGYGGPLTCDNFSHFAAGNFCCRGEQPCHPATLLRDLVPLAAQVSQAPAEQERLHALLRRHCDVDVCAEQLLRAYLRALAEKRRLRLLLVGYFGRGNLGDEAILRALARRFSGACAPTSLADAPWYTAPRCDASDARARRAPSARPGAYYARRALLRQDGTVIPSPYARYRGNYERYGRTVARHRPALHVPLRLTPCVLSHRVERTAAGGLRYAGVAALRARSLGRLPSSFGRADALLLGGGELLQTVSRRGRLSLLYYLVLPAIALVRGCPFSLRACGVGELRGALSRRLTAVILRRSVGISLREEASRQRLVACGLHAARLQLLTDGVAAWVRRRDAHLPPVSLPPSLRHGYICICPRESDSQTYDALLRFADEQVPQLPRVYPAMGEEDLPACRALWARESGYVLSVPNEYAARALLGGAEAVISMRLHALLLSEGCRLRLPYGSRINRDKLASFEEL